MLVLALAGACSGRPAPPPPAQVGASWPGCVAVGAFDDAALHGARPPGSGSVPTDFTAARAVRCVVDDGVRLERTTADPADLLAYLARPSEPRTDGPCQAVTVGEPWLFLVDASGRFVAAAVPRDACHQPLGWQQRPLPWDAGASVEKVVGRE